MTRAEATLALIVGKTVERYLGESVQALRWHSECALQVSYDGREWENEAGHSRWHYREVFTPRIFLGAWEEVRTFEEAEPAGLDGHKGWPLAVIGFVHDNGDLQLSVRTSDGIDDGELWLKRRGGK